MKHVTRYWQDPEFRAAVERGKSRAKAEGKKDGWVTYAIHDPTPSDHTGTFRTLIVYVGQSKDFASRVDRQLREARTATRRPATYVEGVRHYAERRSAEVSGD